ncbi:MAG: TetR/AcrR family transcriptional regulator [Pseudomonadota bacterium]
MMTEQKNESGLLAESQQQMVKKGYHHGDLRAALIEATRQLVEEKGPDSFSVSDACRLAGVSTAAPYKHFKDKPEMLTAVVIEGMVRHRANTLAALEGIERGTHARIIAIGKEYLNFALREPGIFRLKFGGFTDRIVDPHLKESGEQTFGVLLNEVAACLGEPEINDEVRRRSFILWSFVHGLSFILYDKQLSDMGGHVDLDALLGDVAKRILS